MSTTNKNKIQPHETTVLLLVYEYSFYAQGHMME
jgi:hypothetical protein